jgi:DNA polymerase-1
LCARLSKLILCLYTINYLFEASLFKKSSPHWRLLRELLEGRRGHRIIAQNAGFEYIWFRDRMGIEMSVGCDTMLSHYALDERSGDDSSGGRGGSYHGLKTLGRLYFDAPDWSRALDRPEWKEDYSNIPRKVLYRYQALDVSITWRLAHKLDELLLAEEEESPSEATPRDAVRGVMLKAVPFLSRLEATGIHIDTDYFTSLAEEWQADCDATLEDIRAEIGNPNFLVTSPKQVAQLLYADLGLKMPKGIKVGKSGVATGKKVLELLTENYPDQPIVRKMGDLRKKKHILATYIKGIPKAVHPVTGRVHTRFLIHGTDTGRLASKNPNLQNIPARIGGIIRDGFVATPGWELLQIDYKQLEFRVAAYFSQDPKLIEYINSERDIHSEVACYYFNCKPEEVDKGRRLDAKAVVFGILYGRGPDSISKEFKITLKEAQRRIDIVGEMFPGLFKWIDRQKETSLSRGFVSTRFGRRRRFPFITRQNQAEIQRYSVNSVIQGTATDICLLSGVRIDKRFDQVRLADATGGASAPRTGRDRT